MFFSLGLPATLISPDIAAFDFGMSDGGCLGFDLIQSGSPSGSPSMFVPDSMEDEACSDVGLLIDEPSIDPTVASTKSPPSTLDSTDVHIYSPSTFVPDSIEEDSCSGLLEIGSPSFVQGGDLMEIGDRGVNISGGQKQRVSTGQIQGRVMGDVCGDSSVGPEDHVLAGAEVPVLCITESGEVLNYQAFTDANGIYTEKKLLKYNVKDPFPDEEEELSPEDELSPGFWYTGSHAASALAPYCSPLRSTCEEKKQICPAVKQFLKLMWEGNVPNLPPSLL